MSIHHRMNDIEGQFDGSDKTCLSFIVCISISMAIIGTGMCVGGVFLVIDAVPNVDSIEWGLAVLGAILVVSGASCVCYSGVIEAVLCCCCCWPCLFFLNTETN